MWYLLALLLKQILILEWQGPVFQHSSSGTLVQRMSAETLAIYYIHWSVTTLKLLTSEINVCVNTLQHSGIPGIHVKDALTYSPFKHCCRQNTPNKDDMSCLNTNTARDLKALVWRPDSFNPYPFENVWDVTELWTEQGLHVKRLSMYMSKNSIKSLTVIKPRCMVT